MNCMLSTGKMRDRVFWNQRVKQLVAKLLVATTAIVIAVVVFRWGLLAGIQSLFQLDESTVTVIRRMGLFCCVVLTYWAYVSFYEKRQASELRPAPIRIAAGAFFGAAVITLVSLILFATGVYQLQAYHGFNTALLGVAGVILVAATIEEVVFRGILFQALEQTWGTVPALWLQSLLFSVLHIANLDTAMGTAELVMTVISGTLIGAFWTLVFIQSRNLWVVSLNHAAWNFAVVLTGLPLSGLDDWGSVAPVESTYHGPNWLTGGGVGPEDSVITVVVVTILLVVMVLWARKTQRFIKPVTGEK